MIPTLSDERQHNLEVMARAFSNLGCRSVLQFLAKQETCSTLDIQREFPSFHTSYLLQTTRPLILNGLVHSELARNLGVGGRRYYTLTPAGRQALLDLHAELTVIATALEAHQ